jgi:hypothetical protein
MTKVLTARRLQLVRKGKSMTRREPLALNWRCESVGRRRTISPLPAHEAADHGRTHTAGFVYDLWSRTSA